MESLEAQAASYTIGAKAIVHDVSVSLGSGELVALVGPNGAGKTTLVRLLAGLLRPDSGAVRLEGRDLHRTRRRRVARRLALLPQDTYTEFMLPVRDVVSMGRYAHRRFAQNWLPEDEEQVTLAMARVSVTELADRSVTTLSGGERQLVFLARALAQQPRFLLLDEPTNNLDIGHQLQLMELVVELAAEGVAVLAVMHDLRLAAAWFPRLVLMHQGQVAADGSTPEVVASPALADAFGVVVSSTPRSNGHGHVADLEFCRRG
jgi:cobalamin transport system ATP-binding protein